MEFSVEPMDYLKASDAEVAAAMSSELARQRRNLELIASENIVSKSPRLGRYDASRRNGRFRRLLI